MEEFQSTVDNGMGGAEQQRQRKGVILRALQGTTSASCHESLGCVTSWGSKFS